MQDIRNAIESLSPRQREILLYVAQHFSSKEIARILDLSAATVDSHIAAALQRMGVRTRREAALLMIELGYASGLPDRNHGAPLSEFHHGGDQPSNRQPLSYQPPASISRAPSQDQTEISRSSAGSGGGSAYPSPRAKSGMGPVIVRYLLDGLYISLFFAVMSAVALGVHWVVIKCEQWHIDPTILYVLKWVSYLLVVLDGVGVVTATGLLTFRFIRAMLTADD